MTGSWRGKLRPPRRLKTTREGKWFLALTLGVGIAAFNTGNNLLYIVLSANLSIVILSGILSEMALRGLRVTVAQPSEAFAGRDALLSVSCGAPPGRRFPALSIDVSFRVDGVPVSARLPDAPAGSPDAVRVSTFRPLRRGIHPVAALSASTRFPFALFEKSLEPAHPAPVTVYPAPLRGSAAPSPGGGGAEIESRRGTAGSGAGVRGVREYVPGDPARDIQWKATARLGRRMVKERERERAGVLEIRLPDGPGGAEFERAVSLACGDVLACERTGIGYRIRRGGLVAVDGTRGGARKRALAFLAEAGREAALAEAPPRNEAAAQPGSADPPPRFDPSAGGVLWLLPRILWGSGLLLLLSAGVPLPFLAVAAAAFAAGTAMELGALPPLSDRRLEPLLGAAVALLAVADFLLAGRDPLRSGALLVLGIQAIRFLFPKRAADGWQLTAVTFLEYLAAASSESGPYFALVAVAFLILFPGAMWSHHAQGRFEAGGGRSRTSPRFAAAVLLSVAAGGILLTAFLFTVTPRLRVGHFSRRIAAARQSVGFSDTISMGDLSGAVNDRRVAARVEFPSGTGGGPPPSPYLKGAAYSVFTGSQWRKGWSPPFPVPRIGTGYHLARLPAGGEAAEADVTLEPMGSTALFAYGTPILVEGPLGDLRADPAGNLVLPTADRPTIRYRVRFSLRPLPPSLAFPPPQEADLRMPPGDWGDLAALAAEIAPAGLPDDERAGRLAAYLQTGYRYTTGGAARGVRDFLFVGKAGYCEHFATALCLLLRASGIPARVAAGYLGGEWNDLGSYLIVRQSDAHAWTEAWIGNRWTTMDATPAQARTGMAVARLRAGTGSKYLDWIRHRWDKYVVDYDLAAQSKGLDAIRAALRRASPRADASAALRGWPIGAVAAAAATAIAWLLWRRRRKAGSGGGEDGPPLPARYARLFRALERNGWRRSPGCPPAEMLRDAAAARPGLAPEVERFLSLYHRDRFGAAALPAELRAEAEALADRLRAALGRGAAR